MQAYFPTTTYGNLKPQEEAWWGGWGFDGQGKWLFGELRNGLLQ